MKKKHWLTATAGVLVAGLLATTYFVRADPKVEAPALKTANTASFTSPSTRTTPW